MASKKFGTVAATTAGAALTAAMLGLAAPAAALPVPGDNAADAVDELNSGGDRAIVDNLSGAPLAQAEVVSVIEGPTIRDTVYEYGQNTINETRQQVPVGNVYYVTVR